MRRLGNWVVGVGKMCCVVTVVHRCGLCCYCEKSCLYCVSYSQYPSLDGRKEAPVIYRVIYVSSFSLPVTRT